MHPIGTMPCAIKMWVPYCIITEEAKLGRLVHRKTCTIVTFTQKTNVLWLVEAILTNYNRYNEILCQWGCNILGPKLVSRIAKLEKAKAKKLTTKLG